MIVSRMISWLYFLRTVFIVYRFLTRARVGDDILDLCGLLIALATLDALCCIRSVMVSLMVSMSSTSCSVGFLIRVGVRSSFILCVRNLHLVASS